MSRPPQQQTPLGTTAAMDPTAADPADWPVRQR